MRVFDIYKQAFDKRIKSFGNKKTQDRILIKMVVQYRKKVGSKTGGIKLYFELKNEMINQNINIGRNQFYRFLRHYNLWIPKRKNYIKTTNSKHFLENIETL